MQRAEKILPVKPLSVGGDYQWTTTILAAAEPAGAAVPAPSVQFDPGWRLRPPSVYYACSLTTHAGTEPAQYHPFLDQIILRETGTERRSSLIKLNTLITEKCVPYEVTFGAGGANIDLPPSPGRWRPIKVWSAPGVEWRSLASDIGPIPPDHPGWALDQCRDSLICGWVVTGIKLIEVQHRSDSFNRLFRNSDACAAELPQRCRGHKAYEQPKNSNNHENFEQRKSRICPLAFSRRVWEMQVTMPVPFLACMSLVAQLYVLPPRVLPSIQKIEGGRPGLVMTNRNGSEDYGVMQVNSIWLSYLSRYTGLDQAVVRERLINRPCFNIAAAGLLLRTHLDRAQGDLMTAIGNYHSHTPIYHNSYRSRVTDAARAMFGRGLPQTETIARN